MRRRLRLLSLGALLLLPGCGQRLRANPFDPHNTVTGGRPPGFVALAGDAKVTLEWSYLPSSGLLGYQLYRRAATDTAFAEIGALIPPTVTTSGDFGLLNGVDYTYRLYFVFGYGLGASPAEDIATPGPLAPWVADLGSAAATELTADGRHILGADPSYPGPTFIAVDTNLGQVWISDTEGGSLVLYTPSSGRHVTLYAGTTPGSIALDPVDGSTWVCDTPTDAVYHFKSDGTPGSPGQLSLISNPLCAAVDPVDRSVWVCERDADHLRHYTSSGSPAGSVNLIAPSRVVVDSLTHAAWVSSFTRQEVYVVANTPAMRDSIGGFAGPIGIAVDPRRGRIWVADAAGDRVVALQRTSPITQEFSVRLPGEPREIALDLATGNAWVTLATAGAVAVVTPDGAVLRRVAGFGQPEGIAIGVSP